MDQNVLYLIRLFDLDADSYAVDTWLNQDFLVFIARDRQRVEEDLRRARSFNLGNIVPFRRLRCKVRERESGGER